MADSSTKTHHTIAIVRGGQVEGLRRRIYRITTGRGRGARVRRCAEDLVTLGSHEGNTIHVPDATVSRFHARIELDAHGWLLTDLDSTNGTFVDKMRVLSAYLDERARLVLGDAELKFEVERAEQELTISDTNRFGALHGGSAVMRRLFTELAQIADSDSTVMLHGETGSGKEVVASEIHRHSARRDGPFVVVDCGGMPDTLLEAELFGHERGAFTGADRTRVGAFEQASGGTLFLDEIAELTPQMQTRLLRVLENHQIKRLGANNWRTVDVRVIAATHQDLARMCNQRRFRDDLYYRLAVLTVRIPPLRDRLEDLPLLVGAILRELGATHQLAIDEQLLVALRARRWAGNVRELYNVIQRAVIQGPEALESDDPRDHDGRSEPYKVAKARAVEQFDRDYLTKMLARHQGNVSAIARDAQVDAAWVFRLVRRYGIDPSTYRPR
jgi:transcriptional regulator with PAS, ATPase and Fis domain